MRRSFHSSQNPARSSSFITNGVRGAVAPISALKLLRSGIKRRRGEGNDYGTSNGREVDIDGNINGNRNQGGNHLVPSPSSSVLLCLLKSPFFSLPLGITELAGPAGVGKTQIALSLCADCVQQQGEYQSKTKAVFIQLGGSSRFLQTASRRLEQMLRSRIAATAVVRNSSDTSTQYRHAQYQYFDDETAHDCLTRILVHWVCNSEELMVLLRTSLPRLLRMHNTTSVVVLDGIANLFRLLPERQQHRLYCSNFKKNDRANRSNPWHDRAVTFFQISNLCKELSSRFEVPFVVLNECTSRIPTAVEQQPKAVLEPALGLAWSQCVNCSFFVSRESTRTSNTTTVPWRNDGKIKQSSRENNCNNEKNQKNVCHRILHCLKAPHVSSEHSTAKFWIDRSGVIPA